MSAPGRGTVTKDGYRAYIRSARWRAVRKRYWASKLDDSCYVCGSEYEPGMNLHHRSYKNLGNEYLRDLVPVCPGCHLAIHQLYESDRSWSLRGLWAATSAARKRYLRAHPADARNAARKARGLGP